MADEKKKETPKAAGEEKAKTAKAKAEEVKEEKPKAAAKSKAAAAEKTETKPKAAAKPKAEKPKEEPAKAEAAASAEEAPAAKEKPEREIIKVSTSPKEAKEQSKKARPWRITAWVIWVLAVASMVVGIIMIMEGNFPWAIGGIVAAAVLCIAGAQFWKKANRIAPCRVPQDGKFINKLRTFLWNQMGLVVTFIIFLPIGLVLLLKSDKLEAKQKKIITAIAAVLFVATGFAVYDYDAPVAEAPVATNASTVQEKIDSGEIVLPEPLTGDLTDPAYWTQYGKSYHFDVDCSTITRSLKIYSGTLADAIEAKKLDPCNICAYGLKKGEVANDLATAGEPTDISAAIDDAINDLLDGGDSSDDSQDNGEDSSIAA